MFEKSRRRIVAAIMAILIFLCLGSLIAIYTFSTNETSKEYYAMLEHYALEYDADEQLYENKMERQDFKSKDISEKEAVFQLSTFSAVVLSKEGEILFVDADKKSSYTTDDLAGFAKEILQERTDRGTKKHMFYIVSEFDDYDLISFMDNTVIWESTKILYRYTIMIESCALVLLFFVAKYIAKKIVDPLEETYKKQKQFISDAEHELKTPVSIASANAEILKREIGDNQWLTNIQYENDRMTKLIEQLLELARTENNKAPMHRVEFSRLTAGVVLPFEGLMFEKRIALKLDISEEIYVEGNSIQLSQLVSGLLDNAISYGKEDGEIVVSLHENRTMAILTVINDGEPIAMEHRKHLFERFYRTDESRNGENNHYGLGLPIAKAIVVSHRGKIEMACKDQKIIFTVKLPKYK